MRYVVFVCNFPSFVFKKFKDSRGEVSPSETMEQTFADWRKVMRKIKGRFLRKEWRFVGLILLAYWAPAAIFLIAARCLGYGGLGVALKVIGSFVAVCGGAFACAFLLGHGGIRGVQFLRRFYVPDKMPWLLVVGGKIVGVLMAVLFVLLYLDWYRNEGLLRFGMSMVLIFFFLVPSAGFFLIGAKKKQKALSAF